MRNNRWAKKEHTPFIDVSTTNLAANCEDGEALATLSIGQKSIKILELKKAATKLALKMMFFEWPRFKLGGTWRFRRAAFNQVIDTQKHICNGKRIMTVWVARAGKYGERENLALEEGRAFIGWGELGDLSRLDTREEVLACVMETYPDIKPGTARNNAGQVFNFLKSFAIGDMFALPLKTRPAIAFGKVVGEYEFIEDNPEDARHSRRIDWIGEPIPRSAFDQDILYSFGSALTVFRVIKNDAEKRIKAVITGKKPVPSAIKVADTELSAGDEDTPDLEQIARQQISDFIGRKFKGHKMEALVAEVLRAQGFEVRMNKRKGADGGADILAGRGPMGFDEPRLCVQVKSTDAAIGSKDYDELKGVMQKFGAAHGLFVSWGGFKGTVEEEARRDFFNIRLWNAEEFVREIQDVYTRLPKELQAEMPMQQIWALIEEG